jgi:hypothetical protein
MKSYPIFLALIIFFQFSSLTYQQVQEESLLNKNITNNSFFKLNLSIDQTLFLYDDGEGYGKFFLTILTSNLSDITINNIQSEIENVKENYFFRIKFNSTTESKGKQILSITAHKKDTMVEITSVLYNETKKGILTYELKTYSIDQEEEVNNNSFIIFLDDEQDNEKLDMKFKFNNDDVKNKNVTFGFICLPTNETKYIALGQNYLDNEDEQDTNLTKKSIVETQFEEKVINKFRKDKKNERKKNKPFLAFIFSVDYNTGVLKYSYSINSEIINIFLIVSIVIALVFAVITFFLIRRKQSSESSTIENTDGLLKDGDKGENEGKDENEGKEDEEKDEKEEKKENEEKDEKEDDNVEEEKKKIKAAEN